MRKEHKIRMVNNFTVLIGLLTIFTIGCRKSSSSENNNGRENTNFAVAVQTPTPALNKENKKVDFQKEEIKKDKSDNEYLITNNSIGKIRLGMTMNDILKIYPDAKFKIVVGTLEEDTSDILATAGGKNLVYFTTDGFQDEETEVLPPKTDKIVFLMTDDPQYKTAEGIAVSQTFGDAERKYGKPKFYSNDYKDFISFEDKNINKAAFYSVHKNQNKNNYSPEIKITHIAAGN